MEQSTKASDDLGRNWWSILKDSPTVLAAIGLFLYGLLYLVYARFYNALGLSPEDVGLGYSNIFLRSLGLLAILSLSGALVVLAYLMSYLNRLLTKPRVDRLSRRGLEVFLRRRERSQQNKVFRLARPAISVIRNVLPVLFVFMFSYQFVQIAATSAQLVQQGGGLNPYRIGPFTILDLRADPVLISWIGNASSDQKALLVHRLLLLGERGGTSVLYDSTSQRLVRVSTAALVLMAANCEATAPDSKQIAESNCKYEYPINRPGVDLQGANLYGHELIEANLQDADLHKADLRNANLFSANLQRVDFGGANLRNADLNRARLEGADLRSADLESAILFSANLQRVDFRGANLRNASFNRARLEGADLRGLNLEDAILLGARADMHTRWPKGFNFKGRGVIMSKS